MIKKITNFLIGTKSFFSIKGKTYKYKAQKVK